MNPNLEFLKNPTSNLVQIAHETRITVKIFHRKNKKTQQQQQQRKRKKKKANVN